MKKFRNVDGRELLRQLESLLNDVQMYARTVDKYVITATTDLEGIITSVSEAFCKISGFSEAELLGNNHNMVRHPDMPDSLHQEMWHKIQAGYPWQGELKNLNKDGGFYWVDVVIEPLQDDLGKVTGYMAVRQDITDKKHVENLTITDELTGAYNRRYYNRILPVEIARAKRDGQYLAFLMVDADHFKKYNDTYGHQAGDSVLVSIVDAMQGCFKRAGDYTFRLGGEEFAVLFRVEDGAHAAIVAERSRKAMYDLDIEHSGNAPHHRVTLSMGLMVLEPDVIYVKEEIYKYADEALYRAKQNGRNCIELCTTEDDIELF